jgi:hypothetical protein
MKIFNASRHQRQILIQLRKDIECIFHKGVLKNINIYFENIRETDGAFGLAYEADKKIQLDINMNGNRLYNIAAHEISHIFGTNHTSDENHLMCGTRWQIN